MNGADCFLISLCTVAIGVAALVVGWHADNIAARVGGSFITVVGVMGTLACGMAG